MQKGNKKLKGDGEVIKPLADATLRMFAHKFLKNGRS
jgi:hypothetical protein